jgi:hypothetical protein
LRAAKGLPVERDVEPLGGEIAFLLRDEVVEAHAFGGDGDVSQARGHEEPPMRGGVPEV